MTVTQLFKLGGARRIDAEYYQPEYLMLEKRIMGAGFPVNRISEVSNFVKKGIFDLSPEFYREQGVPFIRVQNIRSGFLNEAELEFIPITAHQSEIKTELKAHDLVLSKVGTIGEVSIIPSKFDRANFSQNVIGIKVDKHKILPGYLLLFLLSRYGQLQIKRVQMPQVQSKLELEDIRCLKVIRLQSLEEKIHRSVLEAEGLLEQSNLLYFQTENLLLEELGLKDFKPKYELSYSANLSKASKAHRVDAEYFQPAYDEIVNHLTRNFVTEKLKDIVSLLKHGKQPYYVEGGEVPILIQKHLGSQYINLDALNDQDTPRTDRKFIEKYPEYKVQPGDVLFYSVGAYLGRTNVLLNQIDAVPASFITLIRTKKNVCSPMFLAVFLNSKVGQLQSDQRKSASAQQYIYPKDIGEFIIPILPDKTQQEIASLVQRSYEAREKARQLLEEAKSKVENLIEGKG